MADRVIVKHLSTLIRDSGIFAEIGEAGRSTRSRNKDRYATDPAYREKRKQSAKQWNAANPARKRESDRKWSQTNGADASRRYRQRQKEKANVIVG